jgi:hypothetical protein
VTIDLNQIQAAARAGRVRWRYYALMRARQRGISRHDALRVLQEGKIIEQRPHAKLFPKCLMMALVKLDKSLYVAVAHDRRRDYLHIITVHWLDPRLWADPWTRKPKSLKLKEG